jgi:hypothetical protein
MHTGLIATDKEYPMKAQLAIVAVCSALATAAGPAMAKGCLKGAAVGGAAGHVAGHHGLLGAAAGCAIGTHRAKKADEQAVKQKQQLAQKHS